MYSGNEIERENEKKSERERIYVKGKHMEHLIWKIRLSGDMFQNKVDVFVF